MKPMLSASLDGVDLASIDGPYYVSPKLDGVRCLVIEGVAYSRNMKPIRNRFIQEWAKQWHALDGELIVGGPTGGNVLGRTQSGVMSYEGEPDFRFHLFDLTDDLGLPFCERYARMIDLPTRDETLVVVPQLLIYSTKWLKEVEETYLRQGYEGVMLRHPHSPYKQGRSTLRERYLMKLKRFQDGEAVVTGVEEGRKNENTLMRDELGRAKRSYHQENMEPSGMVGTLVCGDLRVAPGTMTHADRKRYWEHPELIVGKTIHWRSFGYGVKDKARFPRFYGVRDDAAPDDSWSPMDRLRSD